MTEPVAPPAAAAPPYYGATTAPEGAAPPAGQPYPPQYPQPGQAAPAAPYAAEPPPKYEDVPKDGAYTQQPQPYGYQTQQQTTIYTQPVPVNQTLIVRHAGYGPTPATVDCPNCQAMITTEISHTSGGLTWLSAGIICLFGCWLGCCLIPFCIPDLQDVEHRCPNCGRHIGTYARL